MRLGAALILAIAVSAHAYADVAVTVYNQNLGLVTQTQSFDLTSGMQGVTMTDVAAQIDPTSVRIAFRGSDVEIYEQNYHYDLVSTDAILKRYLDREIRLIGKEGRVYDGTLLSASGGMYVLQASGGLQLVSAGDILQIDLERLPDGFYTRPTLEWLVGTRRGQSAEAEVSYLTNGISWHAEYVALLNEDDTRLSLSGWSSIDNQSGATYRDAHLKLIAGDIHRAPKGRGMDMTYESMRLLAAAPPEAGFEERAFFEYHLYDLPRPTTISNRETKQIALFEPATVRVEKRYRFRPYRDPKKVAVVVEFKNSKENGLGIPLPAGVVRITKADTDGSKQLLGEDAIDHTPRDEEVSLEVGNAFDLTPEYRVTDRRQISKLVSEMDVEVKLRNHKEEATTIEVEQKAYRWMPWSITRSSHAYEKVDADTFRFRLAVPADGEVVLTYTQRIGS